MNVAESDVARRYTECYMRISNPTDPRPGNWVVAWCSHIRWSDDTQQLRLELDTKGYGRQSLVIPSKLKINLEYPNIGTFQAGHVAGYFVRLAKRQWRRGICTGTVAIGGVGAYMGNRVGLNFDGVQYAFEARQYSWLEAFDLLDKDPKMLSVAVRGNFALARHPALEEGKGSVIETLGVFAMNAEIGILQRGSSKETWQLVHSNPVYHQVFKEVLESANRSRVF